MFVCIVRFHCIFHHFATVECSTVLIVHIYMIQCHHVHRTIEVSTDDMLIIFTYHLFLAIISVIGSIMS